MHSNGASRLCGEKFIPVVVAAEFQAVVEAVGFAAADLPAVVEPAERPVAVAALLWAVLLVVLLAVRQAFLPEAER